MTPEIKTIYTIALSIKDYTVTDPPKYATEVVKKYWRLLTHDTETSSAYLILSAMIYEKNQWVVYMLSLADGTYYTGISNDLNNRLRAHNYGKGSKYVRGRLPFRVVYVEDALNRSTASKREIEIKKLSKLKKSKLAKTWIENNSFPFNR